MIISKLLYDQIVTYWDFIKYGVASANGVLESPYLNEYNKGLLINLMSDKYQCWICVSDDRSHINAIAVTKIVKDIGGIHSLMIDALYVYKYVVEADKVYFMNTIKDFAKELGCRSITLNTNNLTIADIVTKFGFSEPHKTFKIDIGGRYGER